MLFEVFVVTVKGIRFCSCNWAWRDRQLLC